MVLPFMDFEKETWLFWVSIQKTTEN